MSQQYEIPMRLEYQTRVLVEANSPEDALKKARACDFVDDGMNGAELVNWEVVGRPVGEDEP